MPGSVVAARGVSKWFGEVTALDRVEVEIAPGRVHGLVGPNGAGKSTLMAMIFGLCGPDEGEIELFGRTRAVAGREWLDRVGGFVELPRFYPYLTGLANLAVLAKLDGDGGPDPAAVMELVGLAPDDRQKVRGYSLGMRQRLGLASALLRRPRLLVVDEPANGLDPAGIADLLTGLRSLAGDGATVLFSSHDIGQVEGVCDDVTVLAHGRVAYTGSLGDLRRLAPDQSWRLVTSDDDAARREAATRSGVTLEGAGAELVVRAASPALDAYVLHLGSLGIAVRRLVEARTPLEELFRSLTGPGATSADGVG